MTSDAQLTVSQVAATLNVHRSTIEKMIRAGVLKASHLDTGGTRRWIRIAQSELDRYMREGRAAS